jgi:hypothetical protein
MAETTDGDADGINWEKGGGEEEKARRRRADEACL